MRTLLFLIFSTLWVMQSSAQCGTCTPDPTCILTPAYPTLCPETLPDATAGEAYETDIHFYLPYQFFDPDNGVDVQFNQVIVTGTTGLPFGMEVELNEPSGTYLPEEAEHGCARLCGTPLSPGTYNISINIVATVFVPSFGVEVNQAQSFDLVLNVLPGSGGNNSFTFDINSGCDSIGVNFEALLNASPNPTSWAWDFGNGETSDQQFPPTQTYGDTGTYEVSLETQFLQYVITEAHVTSVNGGWCGDAEEPTCDGIFGILPDIYVQIRDASGNLLYQSGSTDNTLTGSWTGLNVVANNPPFTVQVWDEDAVSNNDDLGSFSFNVTSAGNINFSGAGGTSGYLVVDTQVSDSFFNTETITVFPGPTPALEFSELPNMLTVVGDTSLINIEWYFNDEIIEGQNGSELVLLEPGVYYAVVQNGFGCSATTETFTLCPDPEISFNGNNGVISSDDNWPTYQWHYQGEPIPGADLAFYQTEEVGWYSLLITTDYGCTVFSDSLLVCPSVEITFLDDGITMFVPNEFETYQWVYNGIPVQGATSNTFTPENAGTYWVVVTTDYGCNINVQSVLSTVSVAETTLYPGAFTLYPNPSTDGFNLRYTAELPNDVNIVLTDISGRMVRDYGIFNRSNLSHQWFGTDGISSGQYLVVINSKAHRTALRLMVK